MDVAASGVGNDSSERRRRERGSCYMTKQRFTGHSITLPPKSRGLGKRRVYVGVSKGG
jgi:hypothetical protein